MHWVESGRALVTGGTLITVGNGLEFPTEWANKGVSLAAPRLPSLTNSQLLPAPRACERRPRV
jgi:hypothetical protein